MRIDKRKIINTLFISMLFSLILSPFVVQGEVIPVLYPIENALNANSYLYLDGGEYKIDLSDLGFNDTSSTKVYSIIWGEFGDGEDGGSCPTVGAVMANNGNTTVTWTETVGWPILDAELYANMFANCGDGNYYTILQDSASGGNFYFSYVISGSGTIFTPGSGTPNNTTTRIIEFSPADNSTTTSPVDFNLDVYINPSDIGNIAGIKVTLENIDQNVILIGVFSPSNIDLVDYDFTEDNIGSGGEFNFSTSSIPLGDGNYRLKACIKRNYWGSFLYNPFSDLSDCQSHQFVVGQETFIGSISQRMFTDTNTFFGGLTATSSEALARTCNPISGFEIRQCMAYLLIPDGESFRATMDDAKTGILSRIPWGYFSRTYSIFTGNSTSTLPTFTASVQVGSGYTDTPDIETLTFDMNDMIAGAGTLVDSIEDPITGKTFRDIFYPIIQLTVAMSVLFTIVADVSASHRHAEEGESRSKGKLS